MNKGILQAKVQEFINDHLNDDINKLLLGKSPFPELSTKDLAQQIDSKKRCEKKLPFWYKTQGIYFPPKLNIEQASSELTAQYKSRLIKGESLIDLTGGFGVDAFYFSRNAKQVFHVEQNEELSEIANHNARILKADNIQFIKADSIDYLKSSDQVFDTIYIDPARRVHSKKVFLLKDTEPDVVNHLPLLLSKASRIIIKTSPLFDIQSGFKELSHVSEVHVLSIKNDCKELLWVIDKDFEGEAEIIATSLDELDSRRFSFRFSEEKSTQITEYSDPQLYLYEPDVALLKAGCFKTIASSFQLKKLNINSHLYTSETINYNFIGKIFKIESWQHYKDFTKNNLIKKANIISRNFPYSPEKIKKKHKLQDGGETSLFFSSGVENQLLVIQARRA